MSMIRTYVTLTRRLKMKDCHYAFSPLDALMTIIPRRHWVCEKRFAPSIGWASEVRSWNILQTVFRDPIFTERCYLMFQYRYLRVKTAGTSTIQRVRERILIVTDGFIIVEWFTIAECKHTSNYTAVPAGTYIAAVVWIG